MGRSIGRNDEMYHGSTDAASRRVTVRTDWNDALDRAHERNAAPTRGDLPSRMLRDVAEVAAQRDVDRYMAVATVPGISRAFRQCSFALIVLHHELMRIPAMVSEPMLGTIRLQWWRERVAEGPAAQPDGPEALQAIRSAIARHGMDPARAGALVDAVEPLFEAQAAGDRGGVHERLAEASGVLQRSIARLAGVDDGRMLERAAAVGRAYRLAWLDGADAARRELSFARAGDRPQHRAMPAFTLALVTEHRLAHADRPPSAGLPFRIALAGLRRRF